MTEEAVWKALDESVQEVLEKMFFVQIAAESPACVPDETGRPEVAAEVGFRGEPSGSLRLRLPAAAALEMAADFLALDIKAISAVRAEEVVCELANMICGSVLSRLESATTFELAAPRLAAPEPEETGPDDGADTSGTVRYTANLGQGRLLATITLGGRG